MSRQIDIIGAGAGGLASAWYLAQKMPEAHIRVWEKNDSPGGLAGSFATEDFRVEKFYHHIFRRDRAIQQLIAEMDLSHALQWQAAATGSYYFEQPYRLSSPLDVLRFKPLPFIDRLRLGGMVLHARSIRNWKQLDQESARDYILRIGGKRVYEVVWEPLLKGKFGQYADSVSAAWLWSKLVDRGSSRNRSGFEELGYLQGGMGRLFEAVTDKLQALGHEVHFQSGVTQLQEENGRITQIETEQGSFDTDLVIASCQLPDFVSVLPTSQSMYREALESISFLGNVCLVLSLSHSLSDFYWTNVSDPAAPFVGLIEQTNWASTAEFGGKHLVYLSAYVPPEDPRMQMDEATLIDYYLPWVTKMFPHFRRQSIQQSWLWKAAYAQPIVRTGYHKLIPDHKTPWENLYLCSMAQIYPHDRQVSNGIKMAKELCGML